MTRLGLGRAVVFLAIVVIATAFGISGYAATDKAGSEKAREHFKSGEAFFKLEKYKEALDEYEQGYMARSDASFLYNIAQCHRLMGNKTAALRFYRRFLDEATRVPNRPMVEQHIRDLEKALAAAPAEPPPTTAPAAAALPTPPPIDLSAPASSASDSALIGTPATGAGANATTSSDEPLIKRWWFWPAVGVVAIGAGIGTYLAVRGGSDCPAGRVCM
jgi:tetratricopeptide (TPR) repeat protein